MSNAASPNESSSGGAPGSAFDPHSTREELHRYATRFFRRVGELTAALAIQTFPRGLDPPSVEHQDRLDDLRDYIRERDRAMPFMQHTFNWLRVERDDLQVSVDACGPTPPDPQLSVADMHALEDQVADLESRVGQLLQEREPAGEEILDLQEQRDSADRARDQAADQLTGHRGFLPNQVQLDHMTSEYSNLQDRFDQVSRERDTLNAQVQAKDREADELQGRIQKNIEEIKREKSRSPMTEDRKMDLDREEDPDNYNMGGGSDVEETPDPGHTLLDELLEKDHGAASPVPTPELRYLTYEKDRSRKSGAPPSSDPASKSKSKSKSRSTGDPKSSENVDPEPGDQESDADTSTEGDNDEVLDDMLLAQTVMALSRPKSEQRRRDHAAPHRTSAGGDVDPGSGGDSDGGNSSNGSGGGGGGGSPVDPTGMPLLSTMLPRRLFAADHECIPVRQQTHQYNIADVDPWMIQQINTLTIMTMTLEVLSRALSFRPEWIFPGHVPRVATPRPGQHYSHLITVHNVRALMAALPGTSSLEPTFLSQCLFKSRSTVV
ncbi:hypothetical protein PHMEG_00014691 [Phytophthora megakarya]|uniref:Uncharacterized protein n=1 Tax=Phytophthora megakarya TaxID=4795 RepID=A0A225W3P2_9STRA|nr:hypothetical protein PHMEG_00014691 [Phytophthora megakarya]